MAGLFKKNAEELGVSFGEEKEMPSASTDMGNVSYEVPSIHPTFYIGTEEWQPHPRVHWSSRYGIQILSM